VGALAGGGEQGRKRDAVDSHDLGRAPLHSYGPFSREFCRELGFRCTLHIALGSWLFCLELKQKWQKVSLISVISLMRWEKRKLASSLEEMLMLFHNFYNDI